MDLNQKLIESIKEKDLFYKEADPNIFVFEERVKLLCFHCEKYNKSWTCPPKIPDINYKELFNNYKKAIILYYLKKDIKEKEFESIRSESTNVLHKKLLEMEKICWDNNSPMAVSFIGGSCKLCKNGCSPDRCRLPYMARIPIEATGVNVIESLKRVGIDIKFPPKDTLGRYGVLFF